MTAMGDNGTSLAKQCMDFCQALINQGKDIKLSLSVGNDFSFSLDTRGGKAPVMGKKRASPSTLKRNAERRQAFLAKKNAQVPLSHVIQADLATNQQVIEKGSYQCDQCDAAFKTSNGLKIHVGKSHKESLSSPEKLREKTSSPSLTRHPDCSRSLTSSPLLSRREENCQNCEGIFSPGHQCGDNLNPSDCNCTNANCCDCVSGCGGQATSDKGEFCECGAAICCDCTATVNSTYVPCHLQLKRRWNSDL